MANSAKLGTNFTGVQMSPKDTKSLLEAVNDIHPDVPGDSKGLMLERTTRAEEADRIGSVPVPGSVPAAAPSAGSASPAPVRLLSSGVSAAVFWEIG